MKLKVKLNYLRMSPRKVRLVAGLIKGMEVGRARTTLSYLPKRVSIHLLKLLNSGVSVMKHDFNVNEGGLFVRSVVVDSGQVLKRSRARAFGKAAPIKKRTSRIEMILEERGEGSAVKRRKKEEILIREAKSSEDLRDESLKDIATRRHPALAPKTPIKKSVDFVRRVFRRKAI